MKRDKLDRWRTTKTAVSTLHAQVPFYCTLTPRERTTGRAADVENFYRRHGDERRQFRYHVRAIAGRTYRPSKAASMLATLYGRLALRYSGDRESAVYRVAVRRGWVLRHGDAYGTACL